MSLHLRMGLSLSSPHPNVFLPSDLAEVRAGFYWDPAAFAGGVLPEAQGKAASLTVGAGSPSLITNNGSQQIRCAPGAYLTSPSVALGSTTQAYIAGWVRFTAASAGNNTLLACQWGGAASTTKIIVFSDASAIYVFYGDGVSAARSWTYTGLTFPTTFTWVEAMVDTTLGTATARASLATDSVTRAPTATSSGFATIVNTALPFQLCRQAVNTNVNTTDHGLIYALPATPSAADRLRLKAHKPAA